ncbi:MAG: PadR family transcriptional regulator [Solirubrobacteraceae bacterium]
MQHEIRLTPTSYIVLGLLDQAGEATPYELKRRVAVGVGNFWSLQHAQLYSEPERLARAGYLTEERETGGRRRKRYAITRRGRAALHEWLAASTPGLAELRDPGLLKLYLGGDPAVLAAAQLEAHERKLREYQRIRAADDGAGPRGPWLTLDAGIGHEREWVRYWRRLRDAR